MAPYRFCQKPDASRHSIAKEDRNQAKSPPAKGPSSKAVAATSDFRFASIVPVKNHQSPTSFALSIHGTPRPLYRTHGRVTKGGGIKVFTPSAANKTKFREAFTDGMANILSGPILLDKPGRCVSVSMAFYFPRPKKHFVYTSLQDKQLLLSTTAPKFPSKNPDIDNLVKFVMDALEGIIYKNDNQVVKLKASKKYMIYPSNTSYADVQNDDGYTWISVTELEPDSDPISSV